MKKDENQVISDLSNIFSLVGEVNNLKFKCEELIEDPLKQNVLFFNLGKLCNEIQVLASACHEFSQRNME